MVGIRAERRKNFFKPTGKGVKWTIVLALEEKIEKRKNGRHGPGLPEHLTRGPYKRRVS